MSTPETEARSMWLARAAVAMSALALAVSLSGIAPADAVKAVKRALNANAVNGIKASRKPKANHLLPLGADAKLPASVLPNGGARGLRGPTGPQGATGPPGSSMVRIDNGAPVRLPLAPNEDVEVARLDNLPAGSWLLMWSVTADYVGAPVSTWCKLRIGAVDLALADAGLGNAAGAAYAAVITASAATTQPATFSVAMRCWQTGSAASPGVGIDSQHLIAIRADSLEVTGGG